MASISSRPQSRWRTYSTCPYFQAATDMIIMERCTGSIVCMCVCAFYHTYPIVLRGCGLCLWIALGRFMFVNEYSWPIHALFGVTTRIQTAWRHNADACCYNRSSVATAPPATPLQCRVPLNGMFHKTQQRNGTNCEFKKYVITSNFFVLNSLDKSRFKSVCTQYVCDKSENARACAKWQGNALDWCYCMIIFASCGQHKIQLHLWKYLVANCNRPFFSLMTLLIERFWSLHLSS